MSLTPSTSLRKKWTNLILSSGESDQVGVYLPDGVTSPQGSKVLSPERNQYNMFKRSTHFKKACLLHPANSVGCTMDGHCAWRQSGAEAGVIVATNPDVPQRCCRQHGCKNRANLEAHFRTSTCFALLCFCQVVCAMFFPHRPLLRIMFSESTKL